MLKSLKNAHLTVLGNMSVQCFYSIRDETTAKYVSAMVGRTTVFAGSHGSNTGESQTYENFFGFRIKQKQGIQESIGTSVTMTEQARELLQPEQVIKLPRNVCIIFVPEMNPISSTLMRYYQEDYFLDIIREAEETPEPAQLVVEAPPAVEWQDPWPTPQPKRVVKCNNCGKKLRVPAKSRPGKRTSPCPACKEEQQLPGPGQDAT